MKRKSIEKLAMREIFESYRSDKRHNVIVDRAAAEQR